MPFSFDTARSDFEVRVSTYIAPLVQQLPPDDSAQALQEWGAVADRIGQIVDTHRKIAESTELTPQGRIAKGKTKVLSAIDELERTLLQPLAKRTAAMPSEIANIEQAALLDLVPGPKGEGYVRRQDTPEPKEPTIDDLLRERELRDRLYDLDRRTVREMYIQAVQDGSDRELVRAVERAPKAFPIIDDSTASMVREWRIEKSELAAKRRHLQLAHQSYTWLVETALMELDNMRQEIDPGAADAAKKLRLES